MAEVKQKYYTPSALTITLTSLANNGARQSAVIDNTANLFKELRIGGSFKVSNNTLGANPTVDVYAAALTDGTNFGGTNGANVLGGGDGSFTMPSNRGNLVLIASVPIQAQNAVEYFQPRPMTFYFGVVPEKLVIVVENKSGQALDASAAGSIYSIGSTDTAA